MSIKFNADGELLDFGSYAPYQILGDITYAVRVKLDALPASNSADWFIFCAASGETEAENILYGIGVRNNSGSYYWRVIHEYGAGTNLTLDFADTIATGTDYDVLVVRDAVAKEYTVYVNGASIGTQSYANAPTGGTSSVLRVGGSWITSQTVYGDLKDAVIWNRQLTASEISSYSTDAFVVDIARGAMVFYCSLGAIDVNEIDVISGRKPLVYGSPSNVVDLTAPTISPNLANYAKQGYTYDGTYHYTSNDTELYKLDSSWAQVASNTSPFSGLTGTLDHIGDICVTGGYVYAGFGHWNGCTDVRNRYLAKYNASDLSRADAVKIPDSMPVAAVGYDPVTDMIVTVDYCTHPILFFFDKATLEFQFAKLLSPTFSQLMQGIEFKNGVVYLHHNNNIVVAHEVASGQLLWYGKTPAVESEAEGLCFVGNELRAQSVDSTVTQKVYFIDNAPVRSASPSRSISITLDGQANLSNLEYMWFDESLPSSASQPVLTGNNGTVDGAGIFTLDLSGITNLAVGDTGFLVLSNTDGNEATQHRAFAGPVVVQLAQELSMFSVWQAAIGRLHCRLLVAI